MKVLRFDRASAAMALIRLNGSLTPLYDTKNRHCWLVWSVIRPFAPCRLIVSQPARRRSSLLGMNHDFHGGIAVVGRTGIAAFFQLNATDADLAVDHGKRDRLQALVLAGPVDAQPGIDLEHRTVPAASQEAPIPGKEISLAEIEPDALVRAGIDIAEIVVRMGENEHDREGAAFAGLVDAEQAEGLRIAPLDAVGGANDEDLDCIPPAIGSCAADHRQP